jgi:hypothetical protein
MGGRCRQVNLPVVARRAEGLAGASGAKADLTTSDETPIYTSVQKNARFCEPVPHDAAALPNYVYVVHNTRSEKQRSLYFRWTSKLHS